MGVRVCVVVNDVESAKEIFEKRGANYSSRNQSFLINELCFRKNKGVSVLPRVTDYMGMLDSQMRILLNDLSDTSSDPANIMRKYSFNAVMALLIGRGLDPSEEYIMNEFVHVTDELHRINHVGASFLSYFPFLNKLRNNPAFRKALEIRERREQLVRKIQCIGEANRELSNTKTLLETVHDHAQKDGLDDMDVVYLCDALLRGGFDNAACYLLWATLVLARIPRIQEKLRVEMDNVVGSSRHPDYGTDSANMPYLEAFLKELFRFRAPAFLGIPHASLEDDLVENCFIPKNSLVLFMPERFLDGKQAEACKKWNHYAFGAGRRICPGSHFAERELWLGIAGIVWAFSIEEPSRISSDELFPEEDMTRGLANYPLNYQVKFIPRSQQREGIAKE
ncbi:cytochrome P450 [Basidiobolus meristosporus CBS 931.73]|uniref:Cytochrome P450 n=1 Tax=Basidiobolus meristosporus CBS 931.73 TaxID=1314790 RepID=A0A1Y1XI54_9FUNG|nr:cytochrome P450 [Basidiobolus meristosporus CBS 931.73]|eukprot:ORX85440.1 cytochrome P450 [Basidiobolus meristosporus CBS 931.73]